MNITPDEIDKAIEEEKNMTIEFCNRFGGEK